MVSFKTIFACLIAAIGFALLVVNINLHDLACPEPEIKTIGILFWKERVYAINDERMWFCPALPEIEQEAGFMDKLNVRYNEMNMEVREFINDLFELIAFIANQNDGLAAKCVFTLYGVGYLLLVVGKARRHSLACFH